MHEIYLSSVVLDRPPGSTVRAILLPAATPARTWGQRWQRFWGPGWGVAFGIPALVWVAIGVTVVRPSAASPVTTRSVPVMPLGLPDLHASLDALVFMAQAAAAEPGALPAAPAPVVIPQMPGFDQILINLGGWAAILYGLAAKIGRQVDNRVAAIETQLATLSGMPREVRQLRRELRRYRLTPGAHPLPGKSPEEPPG